MGAPHTGALRRDAHRGVLPGQERRGEALARLAGLAAGHVVVGVGVEQARQLAGRDGALVALDELGVVEGGRRRAGHVVHRGALGRVGGHGGRGGAARDGERQQEGGGAEGHRGSERGAEQTGGGRRFVPRSLRAPRAAPHRCSRLVGRVASGRGRSGVVLAHPAPPRRGTPPASRQVASLPAREAGCAVTPWCPPHA